MINKKNAWKNTKFSLKDRSTNKDTNVMYYLQAEIRYQTKLNSYSLRSIIDLKMVLVDEKNVVLAEKIQ